MLTCFRYDDFRGGKICWYWTQTFPGSEIIDPLTIGQPWQYISAETWFHAPNLQPIKHDRKSKAKCPPTRRSVYGHLIKRPNAVLINSRKQKVSRRECTT